MNRFLLILMNETALRFCDKFTPVWTIIGYIIFAIKIMVPVLLIITAMITFVKAITNDKDSDNTEAVKTLGKKVGYAIAVFLVIQLVGVVIDFVFDKTNYEQCATCSFTPFSDGCYILNSNLSTSPNEPGTYYSDPNFGSSSSSNYGSSKISEFFSSSDWNENNYENYQFSIPTDELCYKYNNCNEALFSDGLIMVHNGVFYYQRGEKYNGVPEAKGHGDEGTHSVFWARLKTFFEAAANLNYEIDIIRGVEDGFRSRSTQDYYKCCQETYSGDDVNGKATFNGYSQYKGSIRTSDNHICPQDCKSHNTASPPGTSNHGYGIAADLNFGSNNACLWAHAHAEEYGLAFVQHDEDWHIEPLYKCDITSNTKCTAGNSRQTNYVAPENKNPNSPYYFSRFQDSNKYPTGKNEKKGYCKQYK